MGDENGTRPPGTTACAGVGEEQRAWKEGEHVVWLENRQAVMEDMY